VESHTNHTVTAKFRRKELVVDAVQVTRSNFTDIARWCFGEIRNVDGTPFNATGDINPDTQYIHVRVHHPKSPKQTRAYVGDWILYTDLGYKVYTNKAFVANFDPS
jgi:hypothetical protein